MKRNKLRVFKLMQTAIITSCILSGCGASSSLADTMEIEQQGRMETNSYDYGAAVMDNAYAAESSNAMAVVTDEKSRDGSAQALSTDGMSLLEEKLVYYCDLEIETLDYGETVKYIKEMISQYGGVIQSEDEADNSDNWYYEDYHKTTGTMRNYIEARIPSDNYDSFLTSIDGVGKMKSKSTGIENISQQYYDTTTQIEALEIQEKNLLSMLEKCETIEDMITVQDRLTTVSSELDRLRTDKRYMDTDVAYSYVNINIEEVMEYRYDEEPVRTNTFADRLVNTIKSTGKNFLRFLEDMLFLIIELIPYLVTAGIIYLIFRKKIKIKIEEKKQKREAARIEKMRQNNDNKN